MEIEETEDLEDLQVEKTFTSNGFACVVATVRASHRCGYIAVPEDHVATTIGNHEDIPVKVHGGLTFGPREELGGVEVDEPVRWYGFDCAHAGDKIKFSTGFETDGKDWTPEDVKEELEDLAEQMSEITVQDAVEKKLQYMPDWFQENVEVKDGGE